jgi:hypothetical protein
MLTVTNCSKDFLGPTEEQKLFCRSLSGQCESLEDDHVYRYILKIPSSCCKMESETCTKNTRLLVF